MSYISSCNRLDKSSTEWWAFLAKGHLEARSIPRRFSWSISLRLELLINWFQSHPFVFFSAAHDQGQSRYNLTQAYNSLSAQTTSTLDQVVCQIDALLLLKSELFPFRPLEKILALDKNWTWNFKDLKRVAIFTQILSWQMGKS